MSLIYLDQIKLGETNNVEIGKAIDANYPFGERKRFPYKMWLKARKEFFSKHGLYDLTKMKVAPNDLFSYEQKLNDKKHLKAG